MKFYSAPKTYGAIKPLKRGDKGDAVKTLQRALGVTVDGIFGKETEGAVKVYQKAVLLVVDGVWGSASQARYDELKNIDIYRFKLIPELREKAKLHLLLCEKENLFISITEGFRSMERQAELYAQGRTKPGNIVTNAKPGQSLHNFGKAYDVKFKGVMAYPSDDKLWKAVADIAKKVGLKPGYYFTSFRDRPHIQA